MSGIPAPVDRVVGIVTLSVFTNLPVHGGQLLNGDPTIIEKGFVYLVDQGGGRLEVLKASEFLKRVAAK